MILIAAFPHSDDSDESEEPKVILLSTSTICCQRAGRCLASLRLQQRVCNGRSGQLNLTIRAHLLLCNLSFISQICWTGSYELECTMRVQTYGWTRIAHVEYHPGLETQPCARCYD